MCNSRIIAKSPAGRRGGNGTPWRRIDEQAIPRFACAGHRRQLRNRRGFHQRAGGARLRSRTGRPPTGSARHARRPARAKYGISCARIAFDLSVERPGSRLRELVDGDIDLLINNAGFATQGPFMEGDATDFARVLAVDVGAVVDICHAFLPDMVRRRHGAIMNVSSTTAYQPVPSLAVYAAAKSFVLSFSQSLWFEAKQHGVKVFLRPRPYPHRVLRRDRRNRHRGGPTSDRRPGRDCRPESTRSSQDSTSAVSGAGNTVTAALARLTPRRVLMPALARSLRPVKTRT